MLNANSNCWMLWVCLYFLSSIPGTKITGECHCMFMRSDCCANIMCVHVWVQEWDLALFDFPGQTAEDLSFHKGAIIQVTEHIDAEWRRGRVEGREGLYPAAFTQPHQGTTHCTAFSPILHMFLLACLH